MTQQRDRKGRFVSKHRGNPNVNIVYLFVVLLLLVLMSAYAGYQFGNADGLSSNQPTIYQNGFDEGKIQQKNIDELARNWTKIDYAPSLNAYYNNNNPHIIRFINENFSTKYDYLHVDDFFVRLVVEPPNGDTEFLNEEQRKNLLGKIERGRRG